MITGSRAHAETKTKMCSVIEIKNSDEYYIHYHGPESIMEMKNKAKKGEEHEKEAEKESGNEEDLLMSNEEKDCSVAETTQTPPAVEVTSDRASSLEGEGSGSGSSEDRRSRRSVSSPPSTSSHHCSEVAVTVNSHIPALPQPQPQVQCA